MCCADAGGGGGVRFTKSNPLAAVAWIQTEGKCAVLVEGGVAKLIGGQAHRCTSRGRYTELTLRLFPRSEGGMAFRIPPERRSTYDPNGDVTVHITNDTSMTVTYSWLDYKGDEVQ